MGVPKFFRWISERYPLTSCLITENNVPGFDNLYLDMNGIIHAASHPSSDDGQICIARPEHVVFREIFTYVELLFSKIKPKKLFFLAIDGVAPRAKLNQQRSRRFRTAKEAIETANKRQGQLTEGEKTFDSNCITPGTKFMHDLQSYLKYFVAVKKMKDPQWRSIKVILSGPDCPGEGEHKIMEYIRHSKSQADYDPNTRHCLYGLDADLIMLGLLSHAPNFALLREEVVFGGRNQHHNKKSTIDRVNEGKAGGKLESTRFYLMHLGLVRDYIEEEFVRLSKNVLDVERVIDDIILMAILVGNDFLPHLPNLHVGSNALGLLFDAYKVISPNLLGHLHENGRIHFGRVAQLLKQLSLFELEMMEKEWANRLPSIRNTLPRNTITESMRHVFDATRDHVLFGEGHLEMQVNDSSLRAFMATLANDFNLSLTVDPARQTIILTKTVESDSESEVDSEAQQALQRVIKKYERMKTVPDFDHPDQQNQESQLLTEWKMTYYKAKLGDDAEPSEVAKEFAVGMQWVISYYYEGVASWSWFYPYHYGPHISDLAEEMLKLDGAEIKFDLAAPLRPLEQLMAVLPLASADLLPNCLSELMKEDLNDMYPVTFKQDLNGKKNSWEAIVLIPFLDECRLLEAVQNRYKLLTKFEKGLNEFGPALSFEYISNSPCKLDSPCPQHFPTILDCLTRITTFEFPKVSRNSDIGFWNKCAKSAERMLSDFPTLSSSLVPHHPCLESVGVTVFAKQASPHPSILLCVEASLDQKRYLLEPDSIVLVDWPFLREAVVVEPFIDNEAIMESVKRRLLMGKAIRVPDDDTIVGVRCLAQSTFDVNTGTMTKRFEDAIYYYPRSLIVSNAVFVQSYSELLAKSSQQTLDKLFPSNSRVIFLGRNDFGALANVVQVENKDSVKIHLQSSKGPHSIDLSGFVKKQHQMLDFQNLHSFAKSISLPPLLVSKIYSSFVIYDDLDAQTLNTQSSKHQSHDIGLRVKYESRGLYQIDACKKVGDSQIAFSREARQLLLDYQAAFPELFQRLALVFKESKLFLSLFLSNSANASIDKQTIRAYIAQVKGWLKARQVGSKPLVGEGSVMCTKDMCRHVEKMIQHPQPLCASSVMMLVPPNSLLAVESNAPSTTGSKRYNLGDRIRYSGKLYSFGILGTIVGVLLDEAKTPSAVEVLLDEPLVGLAGDLDGRCSMGRGIVVDVADILNLNNPSMAIDIPEKASPQALFSKPSINNSTPKKQSITELLKRATLSDNSTPPRRPPLKPTPQLPKSSNNK